MRYDSLICRLKFSRPKINVHFAGNHTPDDQTSSARVHNLNRCGQHCLPELAVVLVIDVHRGVPVEGRRELSLLQERTGVRVEEEPLTTTLAGHCDNVGRLSTDSVHEHCADRFDSTDLIR